MKQTGITNTTKFILKESTPILQIKVSLLEETDKKLVKGTIVEGLIKTRNVKHKDKRIPIQLIELVNKKGYIFPQIVNIYIDNFAKFDGLNIKEEQDVKETSFGEKKNNSKNTKNILINYGLPIIGGVLGYNIAEKMELEQKQKIGMVLFFSLLGFLPRFVTK